MSKLEFFRRGIEKDERAISIENHQIEVMLVIEMMSSNSRKKFGNHLRELLNNQKFVSGIDSISKNSVIKYEQIEELQLSDLLKINISDDKKSNEIESLVKNYENQLGNINQKFETKLTKFKVEMNYFLGY